jgi:predicted thioesterase
MAKQVPLGARGEQEMSVEREHTLVHFDSQLPAVLSTPHMIGLMEWAASNALKPFLEGDEISVGTAIHIDHRASATIGEAVRAEAELQSFDGRFYTFAVSAKVAKNGGAPLVLGKGTVNRAIVSLAKINARLNNK